MPNAVLPREAVANDQEVLGDQSEVLGMASDSPSEAKKSEYPYITMKRGEPFIQEHWGWQAAEDAMGEPIIEFTGRLAQFFRFKDDHLEWGGNAWNKETQSCRTRPPEETVWLPVKGIAGLLTVHKSEDDSESFFTVENATDASVWPLIGPGTHTGRMREFKNKPAILVADPGKFIHRIGDGTIPGHPCYVTGCMIPGEYDKDTPLEDVRSVKNSGSALDRIIKHFGKFEVGKHVPIIVGG